MCGDTGGGRCQLYACARGGKGKAWFQRCAWVERVTGCKASSGGRCPSNVAALPYCLTCCSPYLAFSSLTSTVAVAAAWERTRSGPRAGRTGRNAERRTAAAAAGRLRQRQRLGGRSGSGRCAACRAHGNFSAGPYLLGAVLPRGMHADGAMARALMSALISPDLTHKGRSVKPRLACRTRCRAGAGAGP